MIITKAQAIQILSGDPEERRPTLLRIFKRKPEEPWQFWADYGEKFDEIPNVAGMDIEGCTIKVLATWTFNTVNGNALLDTYRHNHAKE
jgi:hypothetical protein